MAQLEYVSAIGSLMYALLNVVELTFSFAISKLAIQVWNIGKLLVKFLVLARTFTTNKTLVPTNV